MSAGEGAEDRLVLVDLKRVSWGFTESRGFRVPAGWLGQRRNRRKSLSIVLKYFDPVMTSSRAKVAHPSKAMLPGGLVCVCRVGLCSMGVSVVGC